MDPGITFIHIPNHSINTNEYTTFDFSRFTKLKELTIGSECFMYVNVFTIDSLNELQLLKIENNSFTKQKNWHGDDSSRSFHVLNCIKLESIEIGCYSFSDYGGGFELVNLPKLSTIKIGDKKSRSWNFYTSSFGIKGRIYVLMMNRSS